MQNKGTHKRNSSTATTGDMEVATVFFNQALRRTDKKLTNFRATLALSGMIDSKTAFMF